MKRRCGGTRTDDANLVGRASYTDGLVTDAEGVVPRVGSPRRASSFAVPTLRLVTPHLPSAYAVSAEHVAGTSRGAVAANSFGAQRLRSRVTVTVAAASPIRLSSVFVDGCRFVSAAQNKCVAAVGRAELSIESCDGCIICASSRWRHYGWCCKRSANDVNSPRNIFSYIQKSWLFWRCKRWRDVNPNA